MFKPAWRRRDTADALNLFHRMAAQARIRPILAGERNERFDVHVPLWPFTVRRYLSNAQVQSAFTHMIDERIRKEISEPGDVADDIMVLWRKDWEERYSVQRRLVGRLGLAIFEWHCVRHRLVARDDK
jgi:hypothetical protein